MVRHHLCPTVFRLNDRHALDHAWISITGRFSDLGILRTHDGATEKRNMGHKDVKGTYKKNCSDSYELEIKIMSVQGHKVFTAWEYETTCRRAVGAETGVRIAKENAELKKVVGCTLKW